MPTSSLTLLTTKQASQLLRLSARTLEGLRVRGGGPVYRKLAGRVFYGLADLLAWVDDRARSSTAERSSTTDSVGSSRQLP
jgi:hypothetical protein